jgi:tRNA threonylcarbamoyladenosine biosynthesis protein TsaE
MRFRSKSPQETAKIARHIAKKLVKNEGPLVVGLVGDLGAGKTAFVNGFARALGVKRPLTSPTFLIIRSYPVKAGSFWRLYHVDAYRIKKISELETLGFKAVLEDEKNIVLIEWAEKIKKMLPRKTVWIKFEHGDKENERMIEINK